MLKDFLRGIFTKPTYFKDRKYILKQPDKVYGNVPLLIVLHGGTGTADSIYSKLKLNKTNKYAVAYLSGTPDPRLPGATWNAGNGCFGKAAELNVDDVLYIRDFIEFVTVKYNIDRDKITILGHSNGAMMAYRYAIQAKYLLPSSIIAISGAIMVPDIVYLPSKVWHIHGKNDDVVPCGGGYSIGTLFPSTTGTAERLLGMGVTPNMLVVEAGHNLTDILKKVDIHNIIEESFK